MIFVYAARGRVGFNYVLLQSNQGQGESRGLREEKVQGQVQFLDLGEIGGGVIEIDKFPVMLLLRIGVVQFAPEARPRSIVFINALSADLELDFFNQRFRREIRGSGRSLLKRNLEPTVAQEIAIPGDRCGKTFSPSSGTIPRGGDGLDRERRVTPIKTFEELQILREIS